MPTVRKGVLTKLRYTLDPAETPEPTFVEIPISKLLGNEAQLFREEAQTEDSINGVPLQSAVTGSAAYPVIIADGDSFMEGLQTASAELTPVWFEETVQGQQPVTIGGETGCQVRIAANPSGSFGSFGVKRIEIGCSGANTGDTYTVASGA